MKDYEKAFDDFIEGENYEIANAAIFNLARKAFYEGWKLAGGQDTNDSKPIEFIFAKEITK